mgnify:CR=1 FL=1
MIELVVIYGLVGAFHALAVSLLCGLKGGSEEDTFELAAFSLMLWPVFYVALATFFAYNAGVWIWEHLIKGEGSNGEKAA